MRLQWVIASFTIGCVAATRTNLIVDTDLFANVEYVVLIWEYYTILKKQ